MDLRGVFRRVIFCEVASAVLFFGSLGSDDSLRSNASQALAELRIRGFQTPSEQTPLRIYPVETGGMEGHQAGSWRPGVIHLRSEPQGEFGAGIYLRHELAHEAAARTCGTKRPVWVEEASAISFSGEAGVPLPLPSAEQVQRLKAAITVDSSLNAEQYQTLRSLVSNFGWPREACRVSEELRAYLVSTEQIENARPSFVVMSVLSGRVLWSEGETKRRLPLGSLLKIPFAAALSGDLSGIEAELVRSDTEALLTRVKSFSRTRWDELVSPLTVSAPPEEGDYRQILGERAPSGEYNLTATLDEAAQMLRLSLLSEPRRFRLLEQNGTLTGSTLAEAPADLKRFLSEFRVLAKTGTAANPENRPLVGSLLLAWPADDPVYLAVFRAGSTRGAGVAERILPLLPELRKRFPPAHGRTRMRVLTKLAREQFSVDAPCGMFDLASRGGARRITSRCGVLKVTTKVPSARSPRFFRGVLELSDIAVLETDSSTYAEQVLHAEAPELKGEARKALSAVIAWNGIHGYSRHSEWSGVCDTTHCMVNLGSSAPAARPPSAPDPELLQLLNEIAKRSGDGWFEFSAGGEQDWERAFALSELAERLGEASVLSVDRSRLRDGSVEISLTYDSGSETVACEVFRSRLKLPSCPQIIQRTDRGYVMRGAGAGHGRGIEVDRIKRLSAEGKTARELVLDAYAAEN